jgi:hypothetical protein
MQGLSHMGEVFRCAPRTRSMTYRKRSDDPVSAPEIPILSPLLGYHER